MHQFIQKFKSNKESQKNLIKNFNRIISVIPI